MFGSQLSETKNAGRYNYRLDDGRKTRESGLEKWTGASVAEVTCPLLQLFPPVLPARTLSRCTL